MPGQLKWTIELPTMGPSRPLEKFDNPHIKFTHWNGKVIDEDRTRRNIDGTKLNASTLTLMSGMMG